MDATDTAGGQIHETNGHICQHLETVEHRSMLPKLETGVLFEEPPPGPPYDLRVATRGERAAEGNALMESACLPEPEISLPVRAEGVNIQGYIDCNYTLMASPTSLPSVSLLKGTSVSSLSPKKSLGLPSPSRNSPTRAVRPNLPMIAESSVMANENGDQRVQSTPQSSPDIPYASLAEPPGMSRQANTGMQGSPKVSRGEVAELVLKLREERRGTLLLVQRIKDLENVVREQETLLRVASSTNPRCEGAGGGQLQLFDRDIFHEQTKQDNLETSHSITPKPTIMSSAEKSKCDAKCQTQSSTLSLLHGEATETQTRHGHNGMSTFQIELDQTQKAKLSALQYKVSSLTQEIDLLQIASDERERKNMRKIRELSEQLHSQECLVLTLHESLAVNEAHCRDMELQAQNLKSEHSTMVKSLLAAMEEAKGLSEERLLSEQAKHKIITETLKLEAENLRRLYLAEQEHPNKISDLVMEKPSNLLDPIYLSPECMHMHESRLSDQDTVDGEMESREKWGERKIDSKPESLCGEAMNEASQMLSVDEFHSGSEEAGRRAKFDDLSATCCENLGMMCPENGKIGDEDCRRRVVGEIYDTTKEELCAAQSNGKERDELAIHLQNKVESLTKQLDAMKKFMRNMTVMG